VKRVLFGLNDRSNTHTKLNQAFADNLCRKRNEGLKNGDSRVFRHFLQKSIANDPMQELTQ
jgi:hypothetical protein